MNARTVNARPEPRPAAGMRLAGAVVLAALLAGACNGAPVRTPEVAAAAAGDTAADSLRARADRARVAGDTAAPLWVIVASDFQCPFCAQWHHESLLALREEYIAPGRIRVAFMNFPLDHHRHARAAANAAMCAGAQDRFWPVHDAIFDTRERWAELGSSAAVFDSLAAAAGVEMTGWRSCVADGVMEPLVRSDRERAMNVGVQSTPTFLITYAAPGRPGQLIRGAAPLAEFRQVLDTMLAEAGVR